MNMECFKNVGACTGEVECIIPEKKLDYSGVNIIEEAIIKSQFVEYKIINRLDKPAESIFGFLSVLPGCFSTF